MGSIIKSHNKKLTNAENKRTKDYNCRKKEECHLEGKCRSKDIIYKCVVTVTGHPRKVYLGTAEGDFKQRYYNHKKYLKIENMQTRHHYQNTSGKRKINTINTTPNLMWCTVKSVPGYSNISKRCMLCLHEKYEILNYPDQEELLNKRSELVSKCQHFNKFLLSNYKSND